jgi:outer membrane biosynthesis protein TonB
VRPRTTDPKRAPAKGGQNASFGFGLPASLLAHVGLVAIGLISWQAAPRFTPEAVISVDLVADEASVIGPNTAPETASPGEETSDAPEAPDPVSDAVPEASQEQPAPQKAPDQPEQPKLTPKAAPQKAQAPASAPAKAPTKPPAQAPPPPQFDFAAASAAASGADSGGRRAPKLTASGQAAKQGRAGGGSQLTGDLEAALRRQIYSCWLEPAQTSGLDRLVVEVQIELAADGRLVREPKLIRPSSRLGADGALLVAIDNALRAVRQCAPFNLPQDRFSQWRLVNFSFDKRKKAELP